VFAQNCAEAVLVYVGGMEGAVSTVPVS